MWFGGGYARRLEPFLKGIASTITLEGMLLRHGIKPMDKDELVGTFPVLPRSLVAERVGDKYQPALEIPDLD